jgi:hypothetical protein
MYIGMFFDGVMQFRTITFPPDDYDMNKLAAVIEQYGDFSNGKVTLALDSISGLNVEIKFIDSRIVKNDAVIFIIFSDEELKKGYYNNSIILEPQSINALFQNYKTTLNVWSNPPRDSFEYYLDLLPLRNIYITCSELSSYSSITNFLWDGQTIIKKVPVNVPHGSIIFYSQQLHGDVFQCGNLSLRTLSCQLRNAQGVILILKSHWSATIIFIRGDI